MQLHQNTGGRVSMYCSFNPGFGNDAGYIRQREEIYQRSTGYMEDNHVKDDYMENGY